MRKSIILAAAVAALAMLASCQKEEFVCEPAGTGEGLVFTATIDNPATRTTVNTDASDTENRGKVSWENDDEITISDGTNTAIYSISSITDGKATFAYKSGQTLATSGVTYTATYGPSSLNAQTYSPTAGDLPMTAESNTTSLNFSITCGLLKLTLTKADESIKSIAVSDGSSTYTLICNHAVNIVSGGDFFIALPAATYNKFILTNSTGSTCVIDAASGGLTIQANKIQPLSFSSRISFPTGNTGTAKARLDGINESDVTWVQLWKGGPKWATINVGVTDPATTTSYGDYYTWGGHTSLADLYTNDSNTGSAPLEGTDDTVFYIWGDNWQMPTSEYFSQLIANCTCTYTSGGLLVTGTGDYASSSIFLPAAGIRNVTGIESTGLQGHYWSSDPGDNTIASNFAFSSSNGTTLESTQVSGYSRYYGCSLRAVLNDEKVHINIPDANLKSYMLANFDSNSDGGISILEAEAVTSIDCSGLGVTDLTGLEHCVNLESLRVNNNLGLTTVNLAIFPKLSVFDAGFTNIKSLDVSQNPELTDLSIYDCPCTSLNLSQNTKLETLNVGASDLTTLDISNNTSLRYLYVHYTEITSLDLSNNDDLEIVYASNSALTSLDLRGKTALAELDVTGCTALSSLDLGGCSLLERLDASGLALASLDVDGCSVMTSIQVSDNPALTSLDVSTLANLSFLDAGLTGITSLDVSHNTELVNLSISCCSCTSLDVRNNTKLETLNVGASGLTTLDISNNTALKELYVHYTAIPSLDLTCNTALRELNIASTPITSLNLAPCPSLSKLVLHDCTALTTLANLKKTTVLYVTTVNSNQLHRSIYQVGQLVVPDDDRDCAGSMGVVYIKDDKGTGWYGGTQVKIVSVDEGYAAWGYYDEDVDADSRENGWYNTGQIPDSPAAKWCTDHGYGWYMPALGDVKSLLYPSYTAYLLYRSVNETLQAAGITSLISTEDIYWTSFDSYSNDKKACGVSNKDKESEVYYIRTESHYVRAIYKVADQDD